MPAVEKRAPRPEDLYRVVIPSDPRLSPDGSAVTFTVQRVGPAFDRYGTAIWIAPTDASAPPRQLTLGARRDSQARWSPDGATIAFVSDRRTLVEEEPGVPKDREDIAQIHVLPAAGPGEARRLTDLPRGINAFWWSPDGRWLAALSTSRAATREADAKARRKLPEPKPGEPPRSDYRFAERLHFQQNGQGFVANRVSQLWLVEAATGAARRLTNLPAGVDDVAWSPDGARIAIATGAARNFDLDYRSRILVIDVASDRMTAVAEHPDGFYFAPTWLSGGDRIAVLGGRLPHVGYRSDVLVFAADGSDSDGRDLSSAHDLMPSSTMNSDLAIGEAPRLIAEGDGRGLLVLAPHRGAMDLWRIGVDDGSLARLTDGHHYLSAVDAVAFGDGLRIAAIRSTPTELPDVHVATLEPGGGQKLALGRLTDLNRRFLDDVGLREPIERWVEVDGRSVQGWLIPSGDGARPTVLEIHGGPHTLYGWSPFLEFQVLAGAGMSVVYSNPRGSEGYGRDFNEANRNDWGDGPTRDVLAVLDRFVADGLADADRLGVTGGSYGGYLTSWIVGHDQRFRAAMTCRSVNELQVLMLTGDLGGTEWPRDEFFAWTWEDPERFRLASPLTYAEHIHTPLLIQHAERDLRTTIDQGEMLFSVLRRLRRPVRLMRVPDENHELTRNGTPFRRVENLVQVRAWFDHFLVKGRTRMPSLPATRFGS